MLLFTSSIFLFTFLKCSFIFFFKLLNFLFIFLKRSFIFFFKFLNFLFTFLKRSFIFFFKLSNFLFIFFFVFSNFLFISLIWFAMNLHWLRNFFRICSLYTSDVRLNIVRFRSIYSNGEFYSDDDVQKNFLINCLITTMKHVNLYFICDIVK